MCKLKVCVCLIIIHILWFYCIYATHWLFGTLNRDSNLLISETEYWKFTLTNKAVLYYTILWLYTIIYVFLFLECELNKCEKNVYGVIRMVLELNTLKFIQNTKIIKRKLSYSIYLYTHTYVKVISDHKFDPSFSRNVSPVSII